MRIGLTGGIASGKSTVARELERLGAIVIDADVLAREVVAPGTDGLAELVARFGPGILNPDQSLDRAQVACLIFGNAAARAEVNAIIHPRVRARATELEAAAPASAVVVHVIPLLVETGQHERFDTLVVVDVPVEEQLGRLMARDGLSRAEATARVEAQASREERLRVATHVIDANQPMDRTLNQVRELWARISESPETSGRSS